MWKYTKEVVLKTLEELTTIYQFSQKWLTDGAVNHRQLSDYTTPSFIGMATLSVYTDSQKKNFATQLYRKFYTPRLQNYSNVLKDIENAKENDKESNVLWESEERSKQLINSSNIKDFRSLTIIRVRQINCWLQRCLGKNTKISTSLVFFLGVLSI